LVFQAGRRPISAKIWKVFVQTLKSRHPEKL
jgi:hypothetical protein